MGLNNVGWAAPVLFGTMVRVLLSIMYAVSRAVLGLVVLRARGGAAKDVELTWQRQPTVTDAQPGRVAAS